MIKYTAGERLTIGDVIYLNQDDGLIYKMTKDVDALNTEFRFALEDTKKGGIVEPVKGGCIKFYPCPSELYMDVN